jgi:hypothetical protein
VIYEQANYWLLPKRVEQTIHVAVYRPRADGFGEISRLETYATLWIHGRAGQLRWPWETYRLPSTLTLEAGESPRVGQSTNFQPVQFQLDKTGARYTGSSLALRADGQFTDRTHQQLEAIVEPWLKNTYGLKPEYEQAAQRFTVFVAQALQQAESYASPTLFRRPYSSKSRAMHTLPIRDLNDYEYRVVRHVKVSIEPVLSRDQMFNWFGLPLLLVLTLATGGLMYRRGKLPRRWR